MFAKRRWLWLTVLGLTGLIVLGYVGVHYYLKSDQLRHVVAGKLSQLLETPVEVEELQIGLHSSQARLRIKQPGGGDLGTIESVDANVPLSSLASGRAEPQHLVLRGAHFTLELNRDGSLITQLPGILTGSSNTAESNLPSIHMTSASVTIRQEGRPEFQLTGIEIQATPSTGLVTLNGHANDPRWGQWEAEGSLDVNAKTWQIALNCKQGRLDLDLLRSLPAVPEVVWEQVQPAGATAAKVKFWNDAAGEFHYSVDLKPESAKLGIAKIDATLEQIAGDVRILDGKVELSDCRGQIAGGSVKVRGLLDFVATPSQMQFAVAIEGADVRRLPASWSLPEQFEGRLFGRADLRVLIPADGPVQTQGEGDGTIEGAKVAGLPAEVKLRLRSEGARFRFDSETPPGAQLPRAGLGLVLPLLHVQEPKPEPTTVNAKITLRDIEIAELLKNVKADLPYRIGGKVTVIATVSVPLSDAAPNQKFHVVGNMTAPQVQLENLALRDVTAEVRYEEGRLTLNSLRGRVPEPSGQREGKFSGVAAAAIQPRGDLTATLTLEQLPLEELGKAMPGLPIALGGTVSGKAEFQAPVNQVNDPTTWTATAGLDSAQATIAGRELRAIQFAARIGRGVVTLTEGRLTAERLPLTADGTLELIKPFRYTANLQANAADVVELNRLVPEFPKTVPIRGKLNIRAKASGTLESAAIAASGSVRGDQLQIGSSPANQVTFQWELSRERLLVKDLEASMFQGTITGRAQVPLSPAANGDFALTFKEVDAAAAGRLIPDFPVRIAGRISGKIAGAMPAGQARAATGHLELTAPQLTVQQIPTERLTGTLNLTNDGAIAYQLEGQTLGGTFELKGKYPDQQPGVQGAIRMRDINLARFSRALRIPVLAPLRGRLNLHFEYAHDLSEGRGRLTIHGLRWGDTARGSEIATAIVVRDRTIMLDDLSGNLAGGRLRGRARWGFGPSARNFFVLTLEGIDARRISAEFPDFADRTEGQLSLTLRGRFARDFTGTGQVALTGGRLHGVNVTDLRVPFDWTLSPGGSGEIRIHDAAAQIGQGRVTGQITYTFGETGRLRGQLRFYELRLQAMLPSLAQSPFRGGRATGRFDFADSIIRSPNDIAGTLTATLNQTSVQEMPVLQLLTPYLSPTGVLAPFDSGDIKARLGSGIFRIDRLALANPGAQLFAEGSVSLAGRVDLDVIANTGQIGPNVRLMQVAGLSIPALGPVPIAAVQQVSEFLSHRTLRLTVSGTVAAPIVRVNTAALLSDEAVRFFVSRYVLP